MFEYFYMLLKKDILHDKLQEAVLYIITKIIIEKQVHRLIIF